MAPWCLSRLLCPAPHDDDEPGDEPLQLSPAVAAFFGSWDPYSASLPEPSGVADGELLAALARFDSDDIEPLWGTSGPHWVEEDGGARITHLEGVQPFAVGPCLAHLQYRIGPSGPDALDATVLYDTGAGLESAALPSDTALAQQLLWRAVFEEWSSLTVEVLSYMDPDTDDA